MPNREPLSYHAGHEFLLKLEQAGLTTQDMQAITECPGNTKALKLVNYVRRGYPDIIVPSSIIQAEPFDPVAFLRQGWSIEREEQDERSLALTEVDLSKVKLKTYLRKGEVSITGEEKLNRAKASGDIRLDARFFMALWNNKKLIPESWKGKTIYFDGTILRSPSGGRCVLCLYWLDDQWDWSYYWLEDGWHADEPSAVLAAA